MTTMTEEVSNLTPGPTLLELADAAGMSRRAFLGGTGATAAAVLLGAGALPAAAAPPTLGFTPIAPNTDDAITLPPGYEHQVVYAWGDPINGTAPAFKLDGTNTAAEQRLQAGQGHDGMHYFPLGGPGDVLPLPILGPLLGGLLAALLGRRRRDPRGLLVMNHEFAEDFLIFPEGGTWSAAKTEKSQAAHGVSVIEVVLRNGQWEVVDSPYARRITATTPTVFTGPAAGHPLLQTAADPTGRTALGTFNNCANGYTPWGTYLTCEENFNAYFGTRTAPTPAGSSIPGADAALLQRYGFLAGNGTVANGFGADWYLTDDRFDIAITPNEPNRYGWVVEIDPRDPSSAPAKRTALGRLKHENAWSCEARDGRVVVYTGDDERFEYLYKFVSRRRWRDAIRHGESPLDDGTLYVAAFDAGPVTGDGQGTGRWIPLTLSSPKVGGGTLGDQFATLGELLVKARAAADLVGATKMDRPEWVAVSPRERGVAFGTFTNNTNRTAAQIDEANPRASNANGHIIRWAEAGGDHAATTFTWSIYALAGDPANPAHGATPGNDAFGSPDGLWFDKDGRLWVQTDGTQPIACNNQMLVTDPAQGTIKRFLVGPKGCEITGITQTPDGEWLFVNIQHPGEGGTTANPRQVSNWPDFDPNGRPRSATVAIRKTGGGTVGT